MLTSSLPTPPHSRSNTQLPTPETIRQPRKSLPSQSQATSISVSFLPTPQTLPRHRKSPTSNVSRALSPSGQTTFIHSAATTDVPVASGPRRRPGLTFAQQMGLLSTAAPASNGNGGVFGGRLGQGVGMGGGHTSGVHRTVDVIPVPVPVSGKEGNRREEGNPFYVQPTSRTAAGSSSVAAAAPRRSPRTVLRTSLGSASAGHLLSPPADSDEEDETAGPSSPLAKRARPTLSPSTPTSLPRSTHTRLQAPPPLLPSPTPRRSPRQLAKSSAHAQMLDEAHNPFLARPSDVHLPRPNPSGTDECDRPYVTYVFRGSKKVFANPFMRPDMPFPPALLRPEDEEYEEHPCPKPRLLWPTSAKPAVRGGDVEMGEEEEVEVTPSPPSSPVMQTPKTNRRRGFVNADRSLEVGTFDPPSEVYSDSEDERERVHAGNGKKGRGGDGDEGGGVRRGLLFGPGAMSSGMGKRAGEEVVVDRDGKKARTLRM